MLWFAARCQWLGLSLDITTAFLNACLDQEDQSNWTVQLHLGFSATNLRQEGLPSCWNRLQTQVELGGKKIKLVMRQLDSEPNLWRLKKAEEEESESSPNTNYGLVMTYVDDILITAPKEITKAVAAKF